MNWDDVSDPVAPAAEGFDWDSVSDPVGVSQDWDSVSDPVSGAPASTDRTWGEAAKDLVMSFGKGSAGVLGIGGTLYGLSFGDMSNPMRRESERLREFYQERKSPGLRAREERQRAEIEQADGFLDELGTTLRTTVSDPALLSNFMVEQIPNLAASGLGGLLTRAGAVALGAGARGAGMAGTGGAIATGAAMQGADAGGDAYDRLLSEEAAQWAANEAYKDLRARGMSDQEARETVALELSRWAAAKSALVSGAVNTAIPGARSIERVLGRGTPAQGGVGGAVRGFFGEGAAEAVDEGFGAYAANRAVQEVNPEQDALEGVGEATAHGLLFAPFGAATGAMGGSTEPGPRGTPPPRRDEGEDADFDDWDAVSDPVGELPPPRFEVTPEGVAGRPEDIDAARAREAEERASTGLTPDVVRAAEQRQARPERWQEEMAAEEARARRAGEILAPEGAPRALPSPPMGETLRGTPDGQISRMTAAEEAEAAAARRENLILRKDGSPYQTRKAAQVAMKSRKLDGYEVIEFEGGWALQPAPPAAPRLLPAPSMMGTPQGETGTLAQFEARDREAREARAASGLTPDVERAGQRHPGAARVSSDGQPSAAPEVVPPAPAQAPEAAQPPSDARIEATQASIRELEQLAEQASPAMRQRLLRDAELLRAEMKGEKPKLSAWERTRQSRQVNPAQDDLITAIRKLGGIDTEIETDWQGRLSHLGERRVGMPGIERPGKGRSLDDLAEVLMEMGYLRTRDAHELEERLSEAETGTKHFSLAIEDEARERHAAEAWEAMGDAAAPDVSTRDEILSAAYADYSGEAAQPGPPGEGQAPFSPALMELADDAEGVDPGAVERILEESATQGLSEQDTARRLLAIIRGAHGEERGADTAGPDARATRPRGEPEAGSGASQADPRGDRPGRGAVQGEQIGLTEPRDERAQALHDRRREVDSRLRGQEDVPAGQGGDLFSPVQADITDVRPPGERPPRSPAPTQTPADAGVSASAVDAAAAETDATPTEGQKQAGNYRKGHVSLHGLDISIENPRGSERSGTDRDGRRWTSTMAHHYGYIRKTEGSDGEQVDVFLGPQAEDASLPVFIVDQVNPRSRRFDEHKVLIGFPDEAAARAGYLANYQDGWQGLGGITEVSLDDFKQWLREGDTTKRFRPASSPPGRAARDPSPAPGATSQRGQEVIADFGERIEGARKDYYAAYAEKMAEAQGADIAAEPLSKSWPEPDYQRLLDDGVDPWTVGFVRAARDEVPSKPRRRWKLAGWVSQVELLRDASNRLLSGDVPKSRVLSLLDQDKYRLIRESVGGRAELYQAVGHKASLKGIRVTLGRYGVYNGEHFNPPKEVWTVEQKAKATAMSNFPRVIAEGDTRAQAIANFKKRIESIELNPPAAKQIKFRVWSKRGEGGFHVGVKIGARYVTVEKFDDVASARKAIQTDYDALAAKLERMKEVPSERRETNEPRVGVDHRGGADVTPAQFQETFGFRGGQFGATLLRSQAEAQQKLNETYDALMDMAGILGLPPRALSLNGELAIAFGARGRGGKDAAAAHYEPGDTVTPGRVVINLTRRRGAGSLAHEWWHALDNYFTRLRGQRGEGQYLTESAEPRGDGVRPEMVEAFQRVVQAINRTRMRERSRKLDQMRAKAYWSTGREMSARAFESFVIEKLRDQGASNDYLANIVSKEYWDAATALGLEKEGTYPYPEAAEVPAIREAFDHFFDTVETRETDSGVAMFARRLRRGEPDKQDYIVPETPEYADNDTGDLAYSPRSAEQRGVEQLPIRLTVGEARGSHRGFGMMHMAQEGDSDARRMAPGHTPDQAENYARHVAMLARSFDEIYTEGNRVIFRSQRANEAIVTQRIRDRETGESFYSVLTVVPSTRPVWGDPVWRAGRAQLPADRTLKPGAPGLSPDQESQRSGHQTLGEVQTERFNIARERERTQARRAGGATRVTYKKRRRIVRTKDDDFRASLSQGSAGSEGVSAERKTQAEAIVSAVTGSWKNAPRVHVLSDMTEAPSAVRAADEQERSEGASGEPEGFFYRGEVYLVLDGLDQRPGESFAEAVFRVLAHESLGHAGLRGLFGKDLDPILRQVAFARRKEVAAKAEQYGYAVTMVDARAAVERESDGTLSARQLEARARERLDADRRRAAEEVLADMAQSTPDVGFVRRAVEAIRQALRKLYMAMPADVKKALGQGRFIKWVNGLSDAEIIQNFIVPARRFIQEGPQAEAAGAEAPAFARAPVTDSDAFRRWFGDSKVVDADGNPLVVYHGTNKDFSEFKAGPVWFHTDPQQAFASGEGANVMPAYVKIERPIRRSGYFGMEDFSDPARFKFFDKAAGQWVTPDGVIGDNGVVVAFSPKQVKSATGNRGTFEPENPDIRFSRSTSGLTPAEIRARERREARRAQQQPSAEQSGGQGGRTPPAGRDPSGREPPSFGETGFDVPAGSRLWQELVFKAQDRFSYLSKVQKAAARARGVKELPEGEDAYLAELRYHGRAGAAIEDFQREHVDPLLKVISDRGLAIEDVDRYLHARHAPEANAHLASINPDRADNQALSGMSDEAAADAMREFREAGTLGALEDIGRRVDAITQLSRKTLVESGLETQETIDAWEGAYQHYVPLKRDGFADTPPRRGKGFDIRGRFKRRAGSERGVVHILANVVAQHESAIIRAQKADVGRALLEFARNNPNPDLYVVDKVEYQPHFDAEGLVTYRPAPGMQLADNVLVVRENGVDHSITFNEQNFDAMRIARAMKNLGADDAGTLLRTLHGFTRFLAMMNTSMNPEFVISNFFRDIQTAGYNLSDTEARAMTREIMRDVGKAWRGIRAFQNEKGHPWAKYFDEFRKAGAQTGWLDHYRDVSTRERALRKKVENMKKGTLPAIKRGLTGLVEFIDAENTAVENAIRLSAFVHARKMGMSEAKAARLAKDLTVNFNKRGDAGMMMNALYMFYNASVQGSVRMIRALRHPAVRRLVYGTVVATAMLDILNRTLGGDDDEGKPLYDKIPDHVKNRNIIFMLPGARGDHVKIPAPWGYNVFHVIGQEIGSGFTKRGWEPGASAARITAAIAEAFNPVDSATILQMLSPTITDPLVQWSENKSWHGGPLRPSDNPFGPDTPDSQKYFSNVREPSRWITEKLNRWTGGDEVRPGALDFSPAALDLAIDTLTGGAGRFVADTFGTPIKALKGDEVEAREIPMLRKLYATLGTSDVQREFYQHMDEMRSLEGWYREHKKRGDHAKAEELRRERADEWRLLGRYKAVDVGMRKLRQKAKQCERRGDDACVEQTKEKQRELMKRFNAAYYQGVIAKD